MDSNLIAAQIETHLKVLCSQIGERPTGSDNNRLATDYVAKVLDETGWRVEQTELQVMEWKTRGATLTCGDEGFEVFSSPYSLGCDASGDLVAVDSVEALERAEITGKIVLLHGAIASQQIAPKNFPFWNPEEHQHIVALLERGKPVALVCATERNSATAGGVYPFPLFEDGDFDIPSVYMKDTSGGRLLSMVGKSANLVSRAERTPATAFNVTATNSDRHEGRVVVSAHIDTKIGIPGALDNASGVAVVLALAAVMRDRPHPIELVLFNGEDYYAASGQVRYIEQNTGRFDDIALDINIDGAGYREGRTSFSPFDLPSGIITALDKTLRDNPTLVHGEPWYQSDHSLFLQQGRPAIAVSSEWLITNMTTQQLTHTPQDNLDIIDYGRLAGCTLAIAEIIGRI